jgi:DNA uptake protein ComE-like DNA-binding protein
MLIAPPQPTPTSFSHSNITYRWRKPFYYDSDRYSGVDVDWRVAVMAAQPQLGLSSSWRLGTDSDHHPDSVHAGVRIRMRMKFLITTALAASLVLISACSNQDTEKTKQEAAKATEQIKEGSKVAAVELKKDAKQAAIQGKAIAEGVKQGLATPDKPVNVNSASKIKLQTLPGIDEETASRIIKGRPYHTTDEVGTKGVVSPDQFSAIKDKIVVR